MAYPYWAAQPKRVPKPKPLPSALPDQMVDEFAQRAWGDRGEMFAPEPQPATTVQTGLVIEPPPWAGQAPPPAAEADTGPVPTAAEQMRLAGEVYDPAPFRPPTEFAPLRPCPIDIPPPNWREEEP